jgi:hypothetical protein
MRAIPAATALFALGLAGLAAAQDPNDLPQPEHYFIRLHYSEFRPDSTGKIQKSTDQRDGTLLDLTDDLGLENNRTFEARGIIQFKPGRKIRGSYTPVDVDGDKQINITFNYGNTRYLRDAQVVTSIKGAYYSADFEWDFVKTPRGYLGVILGAKVFDLDAAVVSLSQGVRETDTLRVPIPVIGLAGRAYAGRLSFNGEVSGLSAGKRGYIIDGEGSLRLHVSDRLAAQVGYRLLTVDGKDEGDRVKLRMGGLHFGVELSL